MRILVVDDSAFMRKAISQMINSDPSLQVIATARNGVEAVALAKELRPDVITLDIEMPEMDGLTALRHIMRDAPTQVLMFSSLSDDGSHAAMRALTLGAADVLAKDTVKSPLDITFMRDDLLERIHALNPDRFAPVSINPDNTAQALSSVNQTGSTTLATSAALPGFNARQFDVVCIGASTGGPPAIETLLHDLPNTLRTPILIAQHMPHLFTKSLAERLDQACDLTVHHAQDGQPVEPGHVYIAPGGQHMHLHKVSFGRWFLKINDDPADAPYKPSVNALFHSAANTTGRRTLGIVLTGIGEDGLAGAQALREKGGVILAQNQHSCVVYGMPKAVTNAQLVTASLTPQEIHQCLVQLAPACDG